VAVWRWDLQGSAFGEHAANEDPDADAVLVKFNLRFPGQYLDAETGLHYNYFRDYEPGVGRYVESDPIGLDGGSTTYGYANGDPLTFVDPPGLMGYPMRPNVRSPPPAPPNCNADGCLNCETVRAECLKTTPTGARLIGIAVGCITGIGPGKLGTAGAVGGTTLGTADGYLVDLCERAYLGCKKQNQNRCCPE
jgi:RHS repeat-associated protein